MSDPNRNSVEQSALLQVSARHAGGFDPHERRRTNRLASGVLLATVITGAGLIHEGGGVSNLFDTVKEVGSVGSRCPEASDASKQTVGSLFPVIGAPSAVPEAPINSFGLNMFSAEEYDLIDTLRKDAMLNEPQFSVETYVARANMIDNQVGLEFVVPAESEPNALFTALTPEKLAKDKVLSIAVRKAIAQHAFDIVRLPKEYIEQFGGKTVNLVDITNPVVLGKFDYSDPEAIYLDFNAGPHSTEHELSHRDDYETCGGVFSMLKDPAIEKHNAPLSYVGFEAYFNFEKCKADAIKIAQPIVERCGRDYTEETKDIVAIPYGMVAIQEDKATITETFTTEFGHVKIFAEDTPLRKKGIELMARLYDTNPVIVRYFAAAYEGQRQAVSHMETTNSVK